MLVTINEYLAEIKMTKQKRILVEGKSDQIAISKLLRQYANLEDGEKTISPNFQVETAERIKDDGVLFNRQKIKDVITILDSNSKEKKVVGFIDREFDGFVLEPHHIDDISRSHQTNGSLVLSRGHSLENYLFDICIIKKTVFTISTSDQSQAQNLFEENMIYVLQIACAITLSALELGKQERIHKIFNKVSNSLKDVELTINATGVDLEISKWQSKLTEKLDSSVSAESFKNLFKRNLTRVQTIDSEIVRWLCHGHIGMRLLNELYKECQKMSGVIEKNDMDLLNPDHPQKFATLVSSWATLALTDDLEHPKELIDRIR